MSKVAPLIAAAGPAIAAAAPTLLAVAGPALQAYGSYRQAAEQRDTINQQQAANEDWVNYQRAAQDRARVRETEYREDAQNELYEGLEQVAHEAGAGQDARAEQLNRDLTAHLDVPVGTRKISGVENKEHDADLASQVATATAKTRARMKNIATAAAAGAVPGLIGNALTDARTGMAVDNTKRNLNTNALQFTQSIPPEQIAHKSSGIGEGFQLAGTLLGAADQKWGGQDGEVFANPNATGGGYSMRFPGDANPILDAASKA